MAIHRQGPANQLEVNAPRPPAQLYQRFVYHQDGLPAQGISTGVIDRVVLRQRDADDNPDTGPDGLEETLYYIQNSRGDVMQVIKPIAGPSDEWWNDDRGGYAVESVRYSLYGVPTAIASADINRDGVVDERDVSLFVNGWVQGEIDRRLDVNNNGRLETGPPNDPATGLPISNWDDDDLSLFTREMWDHFYWRFLNGQNPDDGLPLFDGTGAGRGKLSREDIDNRIGAAGMWWDPHLGIYHVRHRAYDPRLGRFLQPDPIGVAGGWNVFEYVGGDPTNGIDPLGLYTLYDWWMDIGAGAGVIGDGVSYVTNSAYRMVAGNGSPQLSEGFEAGIRLREDIARDLNGSAGDAARTHAEDMRNFQREMGTASDLAFNVVL